MIRNLLEKEGIDDKGNCEGIAVHSVQRISEGAISREKLPIEKENSFPYSFHFYSGEKATAECIADAMADNRAGLNHLPSIHRRFDLHVPLPSKDCPTCDETVSV
ncbi:hypothetical protein G4B88_011965 [Cannabis sativa]|uniref:AtTam37 zinc finger domain-containing protein n=1 Tax=Cannabis sativa TaxID=3483 RepID=A0A7J6HF27_CANSA|nr:hypothetical protein G4B88_011965 [Cannabis sativa]